VYRAGFSGRLDGPQYGGPEIMYVSLFGPNRGEAVCVFSFFFGVVGALQKGVALGGRQVGCMRFVACRDVAWIYPELSGALRIKRFRMNMM